MAEIKSAIDLALERTRDLSMTGEERRAARVVEWTGKTRGWIQKYLDNALDIHNLTMNLSSGEKEVLELREILKKELLDFLKLDGDNGKILRLLEQLFGAYTDPIEQLMKTFHSEMDKEKEKRTELIRRGLSDRMISGSAIVPNPAKNETWTAYLKKQEERFRKSVKALSLA